ncbi:MAG TPA: polyribonucleotide nucleotidyltransferase, partial [Clostridia bacterium]|nr:polyribonucleotide nucleotidyltransferase [Clostridia bacterium]
MGGNRDLSAGSTSYLERSLEFHGRKLTLETGRLARQANGAVLVRYGDTAVLCTATASKEPREGIDFFPLTVDYEERLYAVGKIPGGFIKREGRPSEKAILSARLIDRPIRPLFPKGYRNDVHIVATVLSVDQDNPPDVAAMVGTSAALAVSDIPFYTPIAAVLVGLVDGQLVINPTLEQMEKSALHLVVAGTKEAIMMVEAGADEVPESIVLDGIMLAHESIKTLIDFIEDFVSEAKELGLAKEKIQVEPPVMPEIFDQEFRNLAEPEVEKALRQCAAEQKKKWEREAFLTQVREEIIQQFAAQHPELEEQYPDYAAQCQNVLDDLEKRIMRRMILGENLRVDGRKTDEIRPITCQVGVLPRTHGTGLFTRGETQVLTVATLGAVGDEQILDGLEVEESKRYMHHYNFPP